MADISDDFIEKITSQINLATTGLFRVHADRSQVEGTIHIGAGTFVRIGNNYGILTATHVSDELEQGSHLGMVVAREGDVHRFEIPRSTLAVTEVAARRTDEFGPDLSFISLTDWEGISTVRASRSFHGLDSDREDLVNSPPHLHSGLWFACGTPEERIRFEEGQAGFDNVIAVQNYCGVGGVDPSYTRNGYDYFEFPVVDDGPEVPSSFEGMSGGSLWQVTLARHDDGHLEPDRYLLMGNIFYQDVRETGVRFLRCHGPMTLYRHLLNRVMA